MHLYIRCVHGRREIQEPPISYLSREWNFMLFKNEVFRVQEVKPFSHVHISSK